MDFAKVKDGEALRIPADTYNAFIDAAIANRNKTAPPAGSQPVKPRAADIILVKNGSGTNLDRFAAVKLVEPLFLPDDNENEFAKRVALKVDVPDGNEGGKFFIVQEPLADGSIGEAVAAGVTICKINLINASDSKVDTVNADTTPHSSGSGSTDILWVKGGVGTADDTGEQWAIIKLSSSGGDKLYTYQITSNCNKAATYIGTGYLLDMASLQCSDSSISMPEGLTGGVDVLIVNLDEASNGGNTHWLQVGSWGVGVAKGADVDGWPKIETTSGYYRKGSGLLLGMSGPNTIIGQGVNDLQWDRDTDDKAVMTYDVTDIWFWPGSPGNCPADPPKLIGRKRLKAYDAAGRLTSVGYENEFTIATSCCPPQSTISSPTFATQDQYITSVASRASTSGTLI